ncbi:hypothetical protein [Psychrobacter sanguinis]|uniref:hypothetical protein n=1 Tax=Psychrobacter sanguinis TaxID=861445 RepID=UPI0028A664AE|nr:hypothetical protein [Psychrobacter sanguinis]
MKNSMKLTLLTTAMAAVMSLTACQKPAEEAPQPEAETDVPMSAEPAEGNDPVIVADDLDDVDANSESVTEGEAENGSMAANTDETDVKEPVSVETQPVDTEQTPYAEEAPQQ